MILLPPWQHRQNGLEVAAVNSIITEPCSASVGCCKNATAPFLQRVKNLQCCKKNDAYKKNQRYQFYKYAAVNFTFYITLTFAGYITVFLQSIGFDPRQVGIITAISSVIGIFASPFWGMLSDKIQSVKKVIIIALTIGAVMFALIPWMGDINILGLSFLFIIIPVAISFRTPLMSLVDNWVIQNSSIDKLNYGALRAYGALSFALASLALGYMIPIIGVEFVFVASVLFTVPPLLLIILIKDSSDKKNGVKRSLTFKEMNISQLFKNYYLGTYILFSIFLRIPFQASMIFMPFLIYDIGGDISQLGLIMGIRALLEIPMMVLLKPLRQRFPLYILIMAATIFFMVECILYSIATSFGMLLAISMLQGIGNGLLIPAGATYVFSLAPEQLKATAQTALASTNAIAGIAGGLLGGTLILLFDIRQFYFMVAVMLAVALALFVLSFFIGEKVLGLKRPGLSLN